MTIKFEKIRAGQRLFDVRRAKWPQSFHRKWSVWTVDIVSVNTAERTAVVSWNGNREQVYTERHLTALRANKPKVTS